MNDNFDVKIVHQYDHYTLTIDGVFAGNYDTANEAAKEAEIIIYGYQPMAM